MRRQIVWLSRYPRWLVRSTFISGVVTSKVTGVPRAIQQVASLIAGTRVFHRLAAKSMGLADGRGEEFLSTVPRFSRSSYTRMVRDVFAGVPLDGLAACTVPTLVIASENEPPLAAESARDVSRMMPNAISAIVNGVGHAWNIESPELFNSSVDAWFSRNSLASCLLPA